MKAFREVKPRHEGRMSGNLITNQSIAANMADARNLRIQTDMRVGARVFRIGAPVSDVLAAATAAYNSHPVTQEVTDRQADDVRKTFVRRIHGILSNYSKAGPAAVASANEAFGKALDAFDVLTVSQIDETDRDQFEKRLREFLA